MFEKQLRAGKVINKLRVAKERRKLKTKQN